MGNGKWEMGNGKWEMGNGKWDFLLDWLRTTLQNTQMSILHSTMCLMYKTTLYKNNFIQKQLYKCSGFSYCPYMSLDPKKMSR